MVTSDRCWPKITSDEAFASIGSEERIGQAAIILLYLGYY